MIKALILIMLLIATPAGAAVYSYNCGGFPVDTDVTLSVDIRSNDVPDVFRLSSVLEDREIPVGTVFRHIHINGRVDSTGFARMYVRPLDSVVVPSVVAMTCYPVADPWMYALLGLAGVITAGMVVKAIFVFFRSE